MYINDISILQGHPVRPETKVRKNIGINIFIHDKLI